MSASAIGLAPRARRLLHAVAVGVVLASGRDDSTLLQKEVAQRRTQPVISLKRKVHLLEPGSEVHLNLSPGCKDHDESGDNTCVVPWEKNITVSVNITLATPYKRGDIVNLTYALWGKLGAHFPILEKVEHDLGHAYTSVACGWCGGSCNMTTHGDAMNMKASSPTFFQDYEGCKKLDKIMPTQLVLGPVTLPMPPGPPDTWGIEAELNLNITLLSADKVPRVSAELSADLMPPATSSSPASLLSTEMEAVKSSKVQSELKLVNMRQIFASLSRGFGMRQKQQSTGLLGVIRRVFANVMSAGAQSQQAQEGSRTGTRPVSLRLDIKNMERDDGKHNISLMLGNSCVDNTCMIQFGQPMNLSLDASFDLELEEGSFAEVNMRMKADSEIAPMVKPMMAVFPMMLPLCGTDQTPDMEIMGATMSPLPCGRYTVDVSVPQHELKFPDLSTISMKDLGLDIDGVPDKVGDLPDFATDMTISFKHADGKPLVEATISFSTLV